ncbi:TetR/AcrR family transcriptional regulator [Promicromonospora sp. NPDC052451]|uniref:TetR/AcrR family transcriptional regulator n=1 Tax=unclassified Promicromonospora TaxID=2647929 RepID=UPI0037C6D73C
MVERIVRRLTPKGEATRTRILDAATGLIAAHGVAGTSTDQVRHAAGVSGSQLYHYFATKQALIGAVIARQAAVGPGAPGVLDSMEALEAWADAAVARQGVVGGRCDLSTLAAELCAGDAASRAEIRAGYERWRVALLDALRAMRDRGTLRPDADLDDLALALLAALQGGSLLAQVLGTAEPMRAAMGAALDRVRSCVVEPEG